MNLIANPLFIRLIGFDRCKFYNTGGSILMIFFNECFYLFPIFWNRLIDSNKFITIGESSLPPIGTLDREVVDTCNQMCIE